MEFRGDAQNDPIADHERSILGAADDPPDESESAGRFEARLHEALERLQPIAVRMLNRYRRSASMHTTALINGAMLKLIQYSKRTPIDAMSLRQLIGSAVKAMRSVLVDRARSMRQLERRVRFGSLDGVSERPAVDSRDVDFSLLDILGAALDRLEVSEPRIARAIDLTYFGNLSSAECGAALGVSDRQVRNILNAGKRLLAQELREHRPTP